MARTRRLSALAAVAALALAPGCEKFLLGECNESTLETSRCLGNQPWYCRRDSTNDKDNGAPTWQPLDKCVHDYQCVEKTVANEYFGCAFRGKPYSGCPQLTVLGDYQGLSRDTRCEGTVYIVCANGYRTEHESCLDCSETYDPVNDNYRATCFSSQDRAAGADCDASGECQSNICHEGTCRMACNGDDDCPAGQSCLGNTDHRPFCGQ